MQPVFISLSSASGSPELIYQAIDEIQAQFGHCKISSLYRTSDRAGSKQLYFNACLQFYSDFGPEQLRSQLKALEIKLGRLPEEPPGLHLIDIDLLLVGALIQETKSFQLPHPDLLQYEHVLNPMIEIAPNLVHPIKKIPLEKILNQLVSLNQ